MILFVRGGALGDFVLTLPVLAALFASGQPVDVACARRHRILVRLCGEPRRFWDLDGAESLWMFGGADPVGYASAVTFASGRGELPIATIHGVAARPPPGVQAWRHFAAVLPDSFPTVNPALVLHGAPIRDDRPIVLAPGASDPARSWPLGRWFGLVGRLRRHAPVVLLGGPLEPWAEYRPDLDELVGLAASAGAWLGPDSGPTHLAARMGAPTFAVIAASNLAWAPHSASLVDPADADEPVIDALLAARSVGRRFCPPLTPAREPSG